MAAFGPGMAGSGEAALIGVPRRIASRPAGQSTRAARKAAARADAPGPAP